MGIGLRISSYKQTIKIEKQTLFFWYLSIKWMSLKPCLKRVETNTEQLLNKWPYPELPFKIIIKFMLRTEYNR